MRLGGANNMHPLSCGGRQTERSTHYAVGGGGGGGGVDKLKDPNFHGLNKQEQELTMDMNGLKKPFRNHLENHLETIENFKKTVGFKVS